MKPDFLRHIANPIIDKYVGLGKLTFKDAVEVKRLLFTAEEKYKFSVYGGDPINLAHYLKSEDFKALINILKSRGVEAIITEILEEAKRSYGDMSEIVNTIGDVDELLRYNKSTHDLQLNARSELNYSLNNIANFLNEKLNVKTLITANSIRARLDSAVELKISVFKQHIRLELKINKAADKQLLKTLLRKVFDVAEEIVSI